MTTEKASNIPRCHDLIFVRFKMNAQLHNSAIVELIANFHSRSGAFSLLTY
jgi:hypothetical protein